MHNHNCDNCRSFWRWDPVCCGWRMFINCSNPCRRNRNDDDDFRDNQNCNNDENHTHEFQGSTSIDFNHNHRFAGITGPAIRRGSSHVHRLETRTDSTNHFHTLEEFTGPAINVGGGRHIHFVRGRTSFVSGHLHRFEFATLIEDPINIKNQI